MALGVFVAVLGDKETIVVTDAEAIAVEDEQVIVVVDEEMIVVVLFVVISVEMNYRGCCCGCLQFPAMEPVVFELLVLMSYERLDADVDALKVVAFPAVLMVPEKKYPGIISSIYMIFFREKPCKMSRKSGYLPEYTR